MKFIDLQMQDPLGAFSRFITVREAKESRILDPSLHDFIGDECKCGSERIISRNLKTFMCCDIRCPFKVAHSLHYMLKAFGCKNVGEETCKAIAWHAFKKGKLESHVQFLENPGMWVPMNDVTGSAHDHFVSAVMQIRNSIVTFPELANKVGIPKVGNTAAKILEGMNGTEDLLAELNKYDSIQEFLWHRGVMDAGKAFYFRQFMRDVMFLEYKVFPALAPIGKIELSVVMTGRFTLRGNSITKQEFIDVCNRMAQVSPTLKLFTVKLNAAVKSTRYFIADYVSDTPKYGEATRREQLENKRLIYSADEFFEMLKEYVVQFKEQYMQPEGESASG